MGCAFIFAGQGSQNIGMGRDFYENVAGARELLEFASDELKIDFKKLLFEPNDNLSLSEFTQPAIVLNSLMSFIAFKQSLDVTPKFLLGHSLGEFSALAVANAFDFVDAIKLVHLRGKFMSEACKELGAGMMVVLGLSDEVVQDICFNVRNNQNSIWAANFNCDGQVVVAGIKDDLSKLEQVFKDAGAKRAMLLDMSVASHCPLLQSASERLIPEVSLVIRDQFCPVISNVTAKAYDKKDEAIELLAKQLISCVLYKQSIKSNENEIDCFIEFGSSVLKGINKKITQKPTFSISDMQSLEATIKSLEEL